MSKDEIIKAEKLASEINNFRECYSGNELWGERDSFVSMESLLEFMINHPYMQEIANDIKKLKSK